MSCIKIEEKINNIDNKTITIKDAFRKIFSINAFYINLYITSLVFGIANCELINTRLIDNQNALGNLLNAILGKTKSYEIEELSKKYIQIILELIKVYHLNDKIKIDELTKRIYLFDCNISKVISSINKEKLPYDKVLDKFNIHSKFIITMTVLNIQKKYDESIKKFDEYFNFMLELADKLCFALTQNKIQKGGNGYNNYYDKYLKYKTKYLKLK